MLVITLVALLLVLLDVVTTIKGVKHGLRERHPIVRRTLRGSRRDDLILTGWWLLSAGAILAVSTLPMGWLSISFLLLQVGFHGWAVSNNIRILQKAGLL